MAKNTVLAVGAHPDDLEFGCGGLLYLLSQRGWRVHLLVMTGGEHGGLPAVRVSEQERSAVLLKARLHWGGFRDTEIHTDTNLIKTIDRHVAEIEPRLLLTHYWDDSHQDHRAVSQAVITAGRYVRNLLFYEGPSTFNFMPSTYVDIGQVIKQKLKLLQLHASQVHKTRVPHLSILESAKSVAIYRGHQNKSKYAEALQPLRLSFNDFFL